MRRWICLALLAGCSQSVVGSRFSSEADLAKAMGDFVVMGRFGDHWPAKAVRVEEARGEIRFRAEDATRHYPRLEGYDLRAVFLESASGEETVVALRSKRKR